MEKTGDISPDKTPDTERVLEKANPAVKQATAANRESQVESLDDDVTSRLADAANK